MSSVNAINSNVSFGRAKAASKKAAETEIKQPKPKFSELGNRTMSEKYGDVNINTNTAKFILGDYILDHAIEFGSAALIFLGALAKGKAITNGVGQTLVDAIAKKDVANVLEVGKKTLGKAGSNIVDMIKDPAGSKASIPDVVRSFMNFTKGEITPEQLQINLDKINGVVWNETGAQISNKPTIISKFADTIGALKADKALKASAKAAEKAGNTVDYQALELDATKVGAETTEANKTFFAKHNVTGGIQVAENSTALAGAGATAIGGKKLIDKLTDLNDGTVARKALEANEEQAFEQIENLMTMADEAEANGDLEKAESLRSNAYTIELQTEAERAAVEAKLHRRQQVSQIAKFAYNAI